MKVNQPSRGFWRTALFVVCGACVVCCLQAGTVSAADGPTEDRAFELYQEAAEDFKARDFAAAVAKLEDAYALFPKAIILIKLAEGLEHLGRIEEAQQRFAEVEPEDEEMSQRVQASLRRLSVQLSRPVSVSILTQGLNDVRIVLDGLDIGRVAPTVLEIPRGRHVLQLFKPGYEVFVLDPFEVSGVATAVVDAELVPLLYPVRVNVGKQALEELRVTVQGAPAPLTYDAQSGQVVVLVPYGEHDVVCSGPSGETSRTVRITEGTTAAISCVPADGTSAVIGWSMVTTGSVLFAGGAALLIWHAVDLDFAERNNLRIEDVAIPDRDIVGPVLMGVGAAVGLVSLVFLLDGEDSSDLAWTPVWAPSDSGGIWGFAGRF